MGLFRPERIQGSQGEGVNPDRPVCVEGGRKPIYDVLMATERKCCDGT